MNSCVIMAEILEPAKMRYTQDKQVPIAEVLIQFEGLRSDDPPSKLKAVGWNTMAETLQQTCQPGQRGIFEGRLRMSTVERPEGFKEKIAELTVSRFHLLDGATLSAGGSGDVQAQPIATPTNFSPPAPLPNTPTPPATAAPPNYDEIPF